MDLVAKISSTEKKGGMLAWHFLYFVHHDEIHSSPRRPDDSGSLDRRL